MARKPGPTPLDHARLSEIVERLETARHELLEELDRLYPKSCRATRGAWAIDRALLAIKCDLDGRSSEEMDEPPWGTDIYYGSPDRRAAARERLILTSGSELTTLPAGRPLPSGALWAD